MDTSMSRNKKLGEFLKSRRSRIQPEQVGLSGSYGQRRTPGLRREEVAVLAGVSATYYTCLIRLYMILRNLKFRIKTIYNMCQRYYLSILRHTVQQ